MTSRSQPPAFDLWKTGIRPDHPRLFFNADTWPAVKARALGPCRSHYDRVKAYKVVHPQKKMHL